MYRINYNGQQVSDLIHSKAEAFRRLAAQQAFCHGNYWVEEYEGDSEWVRIKEN